MKVTTEQKAAIVAALFAAGVGGNETVWDAEDNCSRCRECGNIVGAEGRCFDADCWFETARALLAHLKPLPFFDGKVLWSRCWPRVTSEEEVALAFFRRAASSWFERRLPRAA